MTTIVDYNPSGIAANALFNFDEIAGINDYRLLGPITVSVSDAFTRANYTQYTYSTDVYTSAASGATNWTPTQLANIQSILESYSQVANLPFSQVINYSGSNPAQVGNNSDINISLISRSGLGFSGMDSLATNYFAYEGGEIDIVLNTAGFGSSNTTLSINTGGGYTLMHELGHSLGLSHPHSEYVNGKAVLTDAFSATANMGFSKLGFVIRSPEDMNKEYFTMMSYDEQRPSTGWDTYAQTPMILDVLALQEAYGTGSGTTGITNDTITMGASGGVNSYRTYFDLGGIDTVNLSNYTAGAYLHLGTSILGAQYLTGVSMSLADRQLMLAGNAPQSLRWFYGDFENALGGVGSDVITGSALNNAITGAGGNDLIDGGNGIDLAIYSNAASNYTTRISSSNSTVSDKTANRDGTDTLTNVERLKFSDTHIALDVGPTQNAGSVYMLYKAAFNRAPDASGMGYWLAQKDGGSNIVTNIAQGFVNAPEFVAKYGTNPTNASYVDKLYQNVLGRAGESGGVAYWNQQLDAGNISKAAVLVQFATLAEGAANVATLIANGIPYTEYVG